MLDGTILGFMLSRLDGARVGTVDDTKLGVLDGTALGLTLGYVRWHS